MNVKRTVDYTIEIPLSICQVLIEGFELDIYEIDFISPVDLVHQLNEQRKENTRVIPPKTSGSY